MGLARDPGVDGSADEYEPTEEPEEYDDALGREASISMLATAADTEATAADTLRSDRALRGLYCAGDFCHDAGPNFRLTRSLSGAGDVNFERELAATSRLVTLEVEAGEASRWPQ